MKAEAGIFGTLLGAITGIAVLILLLFATWGGDSLIVGFGLVAGVIPAAVTGAIVGLLLGLKIFRGAHAPDPLIRNRWVIGASCCVACAVATCGFAYLELHASSSPPRDRELLTNFNKHRADFDQLAAMAVADQKLMRVDEDWTDPGAPPVSTQRVDLYRSLSKDAQVPRGFTRGEDGGIQFMYWGVGSAVSDDIDKGFAYLPSPPAKTLASLDRYQFLDVPGQIVYRHIEGHWYLYLQYIED